MRKSALVSLSPLICNAEPLYVRLASPSKESVPLNIATLLSAPADTADTAPPPAPPENSIKLPEESTPRV